MGRYVPSPTLGDVHRLLPLLCICSLQTMLLVAVAGDAAVATNGTTVYPSITAACEAQVSAPSCVVANAVVNITDARTDSISQSLVLSNTTVLGPSCEPGPNCANGYYQLQVSGSLNITHGSLLVLSSTAVMVSGGSMFIDDASVIDLNARGPAPATVVPGSAGIGGGNGGSGSACSQYSQSNNLLLPDSLYFGGSSYVSASVGSRGGGRLKLVIPDGDLIVSGTITANGASTPPAVVYSGGGGGTVNIQAQNVFLLPNGTISVVGGDGNGAKSGGGLLCASLCVARFHFSPTVFW